MAEQISREGRLNRRAALTLGAIAGAGAAAAACAPATSSGGPAATQAPLLADKLTVIQDNVIDSMDAHVAQRPQANHIIQRINEPLVERDPETFLPRPKLALSWTRVDPLNWQFKLRPGVKFTNGEAFNASTVKFNFERSFKPDLKSAKGTSFRTIVDTVSVVDELTVNIKTKNPYSMLLERMVPFWMVPEKYTMEKGDTAYGLAPIGTGPYTFVQWTQGQQAVIKRNPDYWGTKGVYEQVVYRQVLEVSTAMAELMAGNADIAFGITPDLIEQVKAGGKDVQINKGVDVVEIRMDVKARGGPNPFTDKRVRLAAAYAIDKESIAKNLLGGHSTVVATNIVPQMFGHDPNVKPYPQDIAKGKQLMAEAGHPNGIDIRFLNYPVSSFPISLTNQLVQAVVSDLAKVGIRATIQTIGATEVSQVTTSGKAGPMYIGGNPNGGFYDGGFGFFYLRQSSNLSYFWSDQLEGMIQKVEQDTNQDNRKKVLSDIQKYLHDEVPYVFGWTGFSAVGVSKKVDISKAFAGPDFVVDRVTPKR